MQRDRSAPQAPLTSDASFLGISKADYERAEFSMGAFRMSRGWLRKGAFQFRGGL